jgi:prephenate dehydrogenase
VANKKFPPPGKGAIIQNAVRITIIGLGLIGGSIGLALKRAGVPGLEIIGFLRRPQSAEEALRRGAIDRTEPDLKAAVERSDVVILSVPIMAISELLSRIADHLQRCGHSVRTDNGHFRAIVQNS